MSLLVILIKRIVSTRKLSLQVAPREEKLFSVYERVIEPPGHIALAEVVAVILRCPNALEINTKNRRLKDQRSKEVVLRVFRLFTTA